MKHTKEYAFSIACNEFKEVELRSTSILRLGFTVGYMKAIEETNVKELLEALKTLKKAYISHCDKPSARLILEVDAVIKKAE